MSAAPGWVEFTVPGDGDAARSVDTIRSTGAPFLRDARADGVITQGLFLRDLGREADVTFQLLPAPGREDELGRRIRRRFGAHVTCRDAQQVPLEGAVFTGADLGPATREFLGTVTPALIDVLTAGTDRSTLLSGAMDLMAAHLPAVADRSRSEAAAAGPPLSFLSFRSHAEAFFVTSRDPDAARKAMDARYDAVAATVEARVGAILAQVAGEGPVVSPTARRWHDAVRAAKPGLVRRFRDGTIVAHTAYANDHLRERDDFAGSEFHQTAGASKRLQAYLGGDPGFLATRLLTSMLYLSLHNVGITLLERYFLCHAVSRACESIYDVDGVAVLAEITK